jgi:hypothetical protein
MSIPTAWSNQTFTKE